MAFLLVRRSRVLRRSLSFVRSTSDLWYGCQPATRVDEALMKRSCSSTTTDSNADEDVPELSGRGVVVGCYSGGGKETYHLTEHAQDIDQRTNGRLSNLINVSGGRVKKGESRLFYDVTEDHAHIAVVGLGPKPREVPANQVVMEDIDIARQHVRSAAAVGAKLLQSARVKEMLFDDFSDAEACAEGVSLGMFSFDKMKSKETSKEEPSTELISSSTDLVSKWNKGRVLGSAQNFARELMESPANHMTPTMFVEAVSNKLGRMRHTLTDPGCLQVIPRPRSWIESQKMGAFLSVAKGSEEEPWLLEVHYNCPGSGKEGESEERPTVLVGKGVTFDTGGISIKPSAGMPAMKGDMGGAACVVATVMAVAQLEYPVNVVGLVPLCENMPSGNAVKPGDVVTAMNGKTISVDNTDAEGRLLLADALCYSHSFNPAAIIDLATLTGAIDVALGSGAAAVFTNSPQLWEELHQAGHVTGDRLWRMPLYGQYTKQIQDRVADVSNVGTRGRSAGACTASAFLKEFVKCERWAHIDIAGVMECHGEVPFLDKGMSGRPTRTLIQYLSS